MVEITEAPVRVAERSCQDYRSFLAGLFFATVQSSSAPHVHAG